jgi:hypothetical protein
MMSEVYTIAQRKALSDQIMQLGNPEHEEIYKIICTHHINHTKNKNGIFFDMSVLSDQTISAIEHFVKYCIDNKKELDDYDQKLQECKMNKNISSLIAPEKHKLSDINGKEVSDNIENASWSKVTLDEESVNKFVKFVHKNTEASDNVMKKKNYQKYSNARKRYGKKVHPELKFEAEQLLKHDAYIIV